LELDHNKLQLDPKVGMWDKASCYAEFERSLFTNAYINSLCKYMSNKVIENICRNRNNRFLFIQGTALTHKTEF